MLDPTDRFNRMLADVFYVRHGRPYDRTNPEDEALLAAIMDWQCMGCPLPSVAENKPQRSDLDAQTRAVLATQNLDELRDVVDGFYDDALIEPERATGPRLVR